MALTRKFLTALGIEENKIDEIIDAHISVTDSLKQERDTLKEKAEKADGIQKQLDKANEKIKELEASSKDDWEEKYNNAIKDKEKAEEDLKNYKADIDNKEKLAKKTDAYKNLLKEVGVSEKRIEAILKVTDLSKIDTDKDGAFKDADNLKENIKDEWSDFIVTAGKQGASTSTPPAGAGNGGGATGASHASQLAKKYYTDLYGSVKED